MSARSKANYCPDVWEPKSYQRKSFGRPHRKQEPVIPIILNGVLLDGIHRSCRAKALPSCSGTSAAGDRFLAYVASRTHGVRTCRSFSARLKTFRQPVVGHKYHPRRPQTQSPGPVRQTKEKGITVPASDSDIKESGLDTTLNICNRCPRPNYHLQPLYNCGRQPLAPTNVFLIGEGGEERGKVHPRAYRFRD